MLRTIKVSKGTDLQSLRGVLLDARFTGPQGEAAIRELKALNPHADVDALKTDTVLFVPDTPAFKPSAAASPQARPGEEFRAFVADALGETVRRRKAAIETRALARADLAAVLKGGEVKRAAAADPDVAAQLETARRSVAEEEKDDKAAEEALASMSKAALAVLGQLKTVLG